MVGHVRRQDHFDVFSGDIPPTTAFPGRDWTKPVLMGKTPERCWGRHGAIGSRRRPLAPLRRLSRSGGAWSDAGAEPGGGSRMSVGHPAQAAVLIRLLIANFQLVEAAIGLGGAQPRSPILLTLRSRNSAARLQSLFRIQNLADSVSQKERIHCRNSALVASSAAVATAYAWRRYWNRQPRP